LHCSHKLIIAGSMRRIGWFLLFLACFPGTATAREALGVFDQWGAFRDDRPLRCFAIAEPTVHYGMRDWRPFASVANWPGQNVRSQLHVRLRKAKLPGAPVILRIGDRRFALVGGGGNAWAPNAQADGAIVAAMRSGGNMSISTRDAKGRVFSEIYPLKGAATAIDAATLGCARLR
jgi:hypothetical protein